MTESDSSPSIEPSQAVLNNTDSNPASEAFQVHFWGVRGSIPTPGETTVRYGGNTACVEAVIGHNRLIFDGGTGLRLLGAHLQRKYDSVSAAIFFTHTHWDRIQGFPFFQPAFQPGNQFRIYGATAPNGASIKQCLTDQMLRPHFSMPLQTMQAQLEFHNIAAGSVVPMDDILVETIATNRHTGALGYRVTWQGHSLVYASDTDTGQESIDPNLLYLAADADVLIFDGTSNDVPLADTQKLSQAHWKTGLEVAAKANVKSLIFFHHHPCYDDDQLDQCQADLHRHFPQAHLAREGMRLQIL